MTNLGNFSTNIIQKIISNKLMILNICTRDLSIEDIYIYVRFYGAYSRFLSPKNTNSYMKNLDNK
jgi:hypothetical protein